MKNTFLLLLGVSFFSTNLLAKPILITVKDPTVNAYSWDTSDLKMADDEYEVEVYLASCKKNESGRMGCDNYLMLGEIDVPGNRTSHKISLFQYETFAFDTDDLTSEQLNDPNLGLYFKVPSNRPAYSQTGLLGECIRHIIRNELVGNTCEQVRNGNRVALTLYVEYEDPKPIQEEYTPLIPEEGSYQDPTF